MASHSQILDYYAAPGTMTLGGKYASTLKNLPDDMSKLISIIQGLVIYDVVAPDFYDCPIPDERQIEIHIRPVEQMLDSIFALDPSPLESARPPEKRLVGRCHHFMLLIVAVLQAKGIPARARCGFGAYFNPGYFEDHWVCEYWNKKEKRWILVDSQLDAVWRKKLHIKFDTLNVPRDQFVVAADAWAQCRTGKANPSKFGISFVKMYGLWFIAGNLIKDLAALNKMEMLPWDVWGAMPRPNNTMQDKKRLKLLDDLAVLTKDPDRSFDDLQKLYQDKDKRFLVPQRVFNALKRHLEDI